MTDPSVPIDPDKFRQTLGHWATGVTIITAVDEGEPVGLAATSFSSLSLDPALVLFCAGNDSSSWPRIQHSRHFCVNVLSEGQELISRQFAGKGDKYSGLGWHRGPSGSPIIEGGLAWIDCAIEAEHPAGDHVIVVGRVLGLGSHDEKPLLFFRGGYGRYDV